MKKVLALVAIVGAAVGGFFFWRSRTSYDEDEFEAPSGYADALSS